MIKLGKSFLAERIVSSSRSKTCVREIFTSMIPIMDFNIIYLKMNNNKSLVVEIIVVDLGPSEILPIRFKFSVLMSFYYLLRHQE